MPDAVEIAQQYAADYPRNSQGDIETIIDVISSDPSPAA